MNESGIRKRPLTTRSCSSRTDIQATRHPSPTTASGKLRIPCWKFLLSVVTVGLPSRPSSQLPQRQEELPPRLRPLILPGRVTPKQTAPLELLSNPYRAGSFASKLSGG